MIVKLGFVFVMLYLYVSANVRLNMVLQHQYAHHRKLWIKDGRPHGWGWFPEETVAGHIFGLPFMARLDSQIAHFVAGIRYLLDTPEWAKEHSYLIQILTQYRLFYAGAVGAVLLALLLPSNLLI